MVTARRDSPLAARTLAAKQRELRPSTIICFRPVCFRSLRPRDSTALEIRLEGRFLSRAKDEKRRSLKRGTIAIIASTIVGSRNSSRLGGECSHCHEPSKAAQTPLTYHERRGRLDARMTPPIEVRTTCGVVSTRRPPARRIRRRTGTESWARERARRRGQMGGMLGCPHLLQP